MSADAKLTTELRDLTFRWIADDVDEASKSELQAVLAGAMAGDSQAVAELRDRMETRLSFGTAGLRGPVRAGTNGMNQAVVTQTTAAVAAWLTERGKAGGVVVIGRDGRHGSEQFATVAGEVLAAAGFDAQLLPDPLPTPVLAYAVTHLGAVAGIQITASHNPPADNGYKLYDETGAQIIAPADRQIEAAVSSAPSARSVPRSSNTHLVGPELLTGYLAKVSALPASIIGVAGRAPVRIAATALHGVGAEVLLPALAGAGFTDVHLVTEQADPDPDFPTVSFPNPEEPGATDLLLDLAANIGADVAIALDPDADRCAVGVPQADGSWRMLRGDETGALLGEYILSSIDIPIDTPSPLVATTIVSSSMLGKIAEAHGARYAETLTGFKWLARAGDGLVFAYEEALGLCVNPEFVHDKDGIAAAVLACDLVATLKGRSRSLPDMLNELTTRHGVHLTDQVSLRLDDLNVRSTLMNEWRSNPPQELAGTPVTAEDLLPKADVIRLRGENLRVIVRPSGTEPKLKIYLEVTGSPTNPTHVRTRLADLRTAVSAFCAHVSAP